jgi:serine/threonine protein kinase
MSVMLACSRCGRPMQTSGIRGMCPRCLFACTTARPTPQRFEEIPLPDTAPEERLEFGMSVGARGRFLLLDKLGEGGMGEVWLASDQELSPTGDLLLVALKFLSEDIRNDPRALAALRMEVLRSQKLSHPNIVKIFDLHVTPTGKPFIKMEYVDGRNLAQWLEQRPDHVMPWRTVAQITRQLAGALDYAHHTESVVHRDIKPSNLLMADGPTVKLSDFGIAMGLRDRIGMGERPSLGTLWYASPQQLTGEHPAPEDDIYALGVTLYELLTGSLPLEADTPDEFIDKVRIELPPPIPERLRTLGRRNDVPARMLGLVQRCLEKDPLLRPKTREIARLLPAVTESESTSRRPEPPMAPEFPETPAPKKRNLAWVWPLLLLLAMGAAWWQNWWDIRGRLAQLNDRIQTQKKTNSSPDSGTTSNDSVPQIESNSPAQPEPPAVEQGTIHVRLLANVSTPIHSTIYEIGGTHAWTRNYEAGRGVFEFSESMPPGKYEVLLSDRQDWTNEIQVETAAGQTANVSLTLSYEDLIVTTEPEHALVEWPGASSRNGKTNSPAPFTGRFRTGLIKFTATNAGYFLAQTNFLFNPVPKQSTTLHLVLQKSSVPLARERFVNSIGMEFLWVPGAGLPLWACVTETSVGNFTLFTKEAKCDATADMMSVTSKGLEKLGHTWNSTGFPQQDDYPVVGVNWNDANQFCSWLTEREHKIGRLSPTQRYRLPRTIEWVLLAGNREFPWGDDPVPIGNYSGREIRKSAWPAPWPILEGRDDGFPRTAPVRTEAFKNSLGFYDLGGNAAEWCQDKKLCGGSWADGEDGGLDFLRTTSFREADANQRDDRNGFRVVIVDEAPSRAANSR